MTFSDLEMVRVVPKRKQSSVPSDGPPFINCFEFLANVGIFDLSRMVVNSQRKLRFPIFGLFENSEKKKILCLLCSREQPQGFARRLGEDSRRREKSEGLAVKPKLCFCVFSKKFKSSKSFLKNFAFVAREKAMSLW